MKLLIKNANVVTMADRNYENGYVAIEGTKIADVGDMKNFRDESEYDNIIDASGKILFPGMIDAHCHVGMFGDSLGFEGDDGNEATDPITPQLRAVDGINPYDRCVADACGAGITTVVTGPGSANPVGGQFAAMKTYGRTMDEMILRAPVAMKFAFGENPKTIYHERKQAPMTRMATASMMREFLIKCKNYKNQIDAFLENSKENKRPEFDFKCEAMLPVMERKIPVKMHAHRADDICTAMRIGKEFDLDYTIEHATEGYLIADVLKENNVNLMVGPTLSDRSKPELRNLTYESYAILAKAGLQIATITDHPVIPIEYLSLCAAVAVKNGLDREIALKSLTINAAKNCRIDDRVGSIEVGKDADMCIFSGDVLDIRSKVEVVIINGKKVK